MIGADEFLEKYPFFKPDKDGLVNPEDLLGGEFFMNGYVIDDFLVPHSSYCWYHGNNKDYNCVNYFIPCVNLQGYDIMDLKGVCIKTNLDIHDIQPKENAQISELGAGSRGLPKFDLDKLFRQETSVITSIKQRVNPKFDTYFNNHIVKTEFISQYADKSLLIEEVGESVFRGEFINRWAHIQFDIENGTVIHFDGGVNVYTEEGKNRRLETTLDKKDKLAIKHIKLFRIDGNMNIDTWQKQIEFLFVYNELITERFDPEGYKEDYKHILEKDLDF
ncbi:hypothetical protein AGMMS50249_3870 [candidate division SR1 bacterium]|nr:hypothetical protein AGMMS50249_3870 [candidate division SR1 bacterium]